MFLNHLLLPSTVGSAVGVSADLVKVESKEDVVLVRMNINGGSPCSFCQFDYVVVRKRDDKPIYLIILFNY